MRKIYVIGCGRSGTSFATQYFKDLGVDLPHEKEGMDGSVNWRITPKVRRDKDFIIHLVRNPYNAIPSMQTIMSASWKYMQKYISIPAELNYQGRCLNYWVKWNQLAEKSAHIRLRVEDLGTSTINSRKKDKKYKQIDWDYLRSTYKDLFNLMVTMAKKYGYKAKYAK